MENKTCGECKHFELDEIAAICHKHCLICNDDAPACEVFEPKVITNGDVIRQMSNEKLVRFKGARHCTFCAYCDQKTDKCNRPIGGTCAEGILAWLNAPAESEVENG